MALDLTRHPCFNDKMRHSFGRVHLPVAPKCNIQCRFCNRKFDCANESRPGVTSIVLSPGQALDYLNRTMEVDPRIAVVGIAGPGDPFANADETMETLRLVRQHYPEMLLCVATNGLNIGPYVQELADLQVSHVTITINALDPDIGANVYAWVRDHKRIYRGRDGAALLLERQLAAVEALKAAGVTVKINSIVIPGINDRHIAAVAEKMRDLGADILNCVPLYPVADTDFEEIDPPDKTAMAHIRGAASQFLPQMHHCTRCRADACGLLGEAMAKVHMDNMRRSAAQPINPEQDKPYVAVASLEGVLVNQHLGEARELLIYGPAQDGQGYQLIEVRNAPEPGGGNTRWIQLANTLHDCRAILVSAAGGQPQQVLKWKGVQTIIIEGLIEEALEAVYSGRPIKMPVRQAKCGIGCRGNGTGCG